MYSNTVLVREEQYPHHNMLNLCKASNYTTIKKFIKIYSKASQCGTSDCVTDFSVFSNPAVA